MTRKRTGRTSPTPRELAAQLRDWGRWPWFDNPEFLDRLDAAADRAFRRRTIEGNIAAIVSYHQLVEEMLRVILQDCRFLVGLRVSPWRIAFLDRDKMTFGGLQQLVREAVEFDGKATLLRISDEINRIRNAIAHRLATRGSFAGLRRDARRAGRAHQRARDVFSKAHDCFCLAFHNIQKDEF